MRSDQVEPYTLEQHQPVKRKQSPWPICARCGLVFLSNDFTAWCIKVGCNNDSHPEYLRRRNAAGASLS